MFRILLCIFVTDCMPIYREGPELSSKSENLCSILEIPWFVPYVVGQ